MSTKNDTKAQKEVWLVYYEHYEGILPEAAFTSEEKALAYVAKYPNTGVKWEHMTLDLDP